MGGAARDAAAVEAQRRSGALFEEFFPTTVSLEKSQAKGN